MKRTRTIPPSVSTLPEDVRERRGTHRGKGIRIAIVCSTFNPDLTGPLLAATVDELIAHGVSAKRVEVVRVPGAFEIPLPLSLLAVGRAFHALIALGVVIEGATPHASLIAGEVTRAIARLSIAHGKPILDAVVCAPDLATAKERCVGRAHNRGRHAARAAIEMVNLLREMESR